MHSNGAFKPSMVGQYMWVYSEWRKILEYKNPNEVRVLWSPLDTSGASVYIATLNKITITKGAGVKLSKLEIDYRPKVR